MKISQSLARSTALSFTKERSILSIQVFPCRPSPSPKDLKKCPDKFRAIADAREGNLFLDDWGVCYFTWQDLADSLTRCGGTIPVGNEGCLGTGLKAKSSTHSTPSIAFIPGRPELEAGRVTSRHLALKKTLSLDAVKF